MKVIVSRSQLPGGLRRESAGARLLGFKVRIPPRAWMSVVCCQVEVFSSGWSLNQRSPTGCSFFWSSVILKPWQLGCRGTLRTVVPWTRNRSLLFSVTYVTYKILKLSLQQLCTPDGDNGYPYPLYCSLTLRLHLFVRTLDNFTRIW
jgi:hypothetical protein